jgi:TPR repeat protein
MASLSSHNIGIPIATQLEWYKIRDTLFGENFVSQDISLAIEMASSCDHPDARWLTDACAGKDVTTVKDAKRVFSALGQNDARALCFAWMLGDQEDLAPLLSSAERGFAFAQAQFPELTDGDEKFKFAQLSAAQGERDGLFWLGLCFRFGDGCEEDLIKAKENFLLASALGEVWSMVHLGKLLEESDPERFCWWGRAAAVGHSANLLSNFVKQVNLFNSGTGSGAVVFSIGRALRGHVNEQAKTIFKERHGFDFDSLIGPAKQAIAFYEAQIKATKDAMRAWTEVGVHFGVVKDLRKLIAKMIWDSREKALYDVSKGRKQEEQEELEVKPSAPSLGVP